MSHAEAIEKLEALHDMLEETLVTLPVKPVRDDGETTEAEVASAVMRAMWRGYQQALKHAIDVMWRMEGLEK